MRTASGLTPGGGPVRLPYMIAQFSAVYVKSGKWFVGFVEELPGVNTQGKTLAEARRNLREALELVLETNRDLSRRQRRQRHKKAVKQEPIEITYK